MKRFTSESLRQFNGKNNQSIYVSYEGKVYDVTKSPLWIQGNHMNVHHAGNDLTKTFLNAPHDTKVFSKFKIVGKLEEIQKQENLCSLVKRIAPHPMLVHFPIAYGMLIPVLSIMYLLTSISSFESASYYLLLFGFLSTPISALSGFVSWNVTYNRNRSSDFNRKIMLSIGLFIVASICAGWRTLNPEVLIVGDWFSYLFLILEVLIAIFVALLGHTGGKIVFSI